MRINVMDLRIGDRFLWEDPLGSEHTMLTVRSGSTNHFGSVTVEVEEWDFDFEATSTTIVEILNRSSD